MIAKTEFEEIMNYLAAGAREPITVKTIDVYFDLLGNFPASALWAAAKKLLFDRKAFPSVGEFRAVAVEILQGQIDEVAPGEAWRLNSRARFRS